MPINVDGNLAALRQYERERDALEMKETEIQERVDSLVDENFTDVGLIDEAIGEVSFENKSEFAHYLNLRHVTDDAEVEKTLGSMLYQFVLEYIESGARQAVEDNLI